MKRGMAWAAVPASGATGLYVGTVLRCAADRLRRHYDPCCEDPLSAKHNPNPTPPATVPQKPQTIPPPSRDEAPYVSTQEPQR